MITNCKISVTLLLAKWSTLKQIHIAFLHRDQGLKIIWNQPNVPPDKQCKGGTLA